MAPIAAASAPDSTSAKARLRRLEVAALLVLGGGIHRHTPLEPDGILPRLRRNLQSALRALPPRHLLESVRADVVHPPLSYLLLWVWVKIGGESMPWVAAVAVP
jgi:hypothetical protein